MLKMRRLHPRDRASRGLSVDADGATLGPHCILVRRTPEGYRSASPKEAASIQKIAFGSERPPDWLFRRCSRIAEALNDNQLALAQIFGVHACPDDELDAQQILALAAAAPLVKANFNPDQPRAPAGNPDGGEWTDGRESGEVVAANDRDRKNKCIEDCHHLLLRPLPYPWSDLKQECVPPVHRRVYAGNGIMEN